MNSKTMQTFLFAVQSAFTAAICWLFMAAYANLANPKDLFIEGLPCFIQTILNIILAGIFLFSNHHASFQEMRVAPLLLLTTSLENVRLVSFYTEASFMPVINEAVIAYTYVAMLLLSAILFCELITVNDTRSFTTINTILTASVFGVALLLAIGPRLSGMKSLEYIPAYYVIAFFFYGTAAIISIFQMINSTSSSSRIKFLAILMLAAGNAMLVIRKAFISAFIGLGTYSAGIIILFSLVTKKNRVYDDTGTSSYSDTAY